MKNQEFENHDRLSKASANQLPHKEATAEIQPKSLPAVQFTKLAGEEIHSQLSPPELFATSSQGNLSIQRQKESEDETDIENGENTQDFTIDDGNEPPLGDDESTINIPEQNSKSIVSENPHDYLKAPEIMGVLDYSMSANFGIGLNDINIVVNSAKASDIGAKAFAQGNDIHFANGEFQPETTAGQRLIGHEVQHIVQQQSGRVKPIVTSNGVSINDDPALEKEADAAGLKFASDLGANSTDIKSRTTKKSARSNISSNTLQRKPAETEAKVENQEEEERRLKDRECIDKALSEETWDVNRVIYIRDVGLFSNATESERLKMIAIVLDQFWVADNDERLLARIWNGWGENVCKAITENMPLYRQCIAAGMAVEDIEFLKKFFKDFELDVRGIAKDYMQKNLQFAIDEQIRLGLKEGEGNQSPTADVERELFIQQMRVNAEQAFHLLDGMEKLRRIHVGYDLDERFPDEKRRQRLKTYFDPKHKPESRSAPGKEAADHSWEEVNKNYTMATAALTALATSSPALYVAISKGKQAVQGLQVDDEGLFIREAGRMLQELEVNAEATLPKVDNGDLDWRDLVPIHDQLYMGKKQGASGVDWSQEAFRSIGQEIISDHQTREFWIDLGLGAASGALFIVANMASFGMASAALLGGLAVSGGMALKAWENYEDLSTAADSGASKETELINNGQVHDAKINAIINSVFFFLDFIGPILKIGKDALKLGRIGREAAERSVQEALKNTAKMSDKEIAQTIARAIDELGVDGARKASGKSLDELENIIKKGGLETAEESRLIPQIEAARLRGNSDDLGKILTKGSTPAETAWLSERGIESACKEMFSAINSGEISKTLADKVLLEAADRLGPLKSLDLVGGWEKASRALGDSSKAGEKFLAFRQSVADDMLGYVRDKLGGEISVTGTLDNFSNDLDASLKGPKAAEHKFAAQAYLTKSLGVANEPAALNSLLMIELFTDAQRMTPYDSLPAAMRQEVAKIQAVKQEQLMYNSRLYHAKHAGDEVLAESVRKQMKEAGVQEFPYKPLSENQIHILYQETDKLWQELNDLVKLGDNAKAREVAIKLSDTQALINATEEGGYFSAGGTRRWVTERPDKGMPRSPHLPPVIPAEQVNSIIDQLPKIDKALVQVRHPDKLIEGVRGMGKYGERIFKVAGEMNPALLAEFDEIIERCVKFKNAADSGATKLIGDSPQAIMKETESLFREIDAKTADILNILKQSIDEPNVSKDAAAAMQQAAENRVVVLSAKDAVLSIMVLFSRAIQAGKPWSEIDPDLAAPEGNPE